MKLTILTLLTLASIMLSSCVVARYETTTSETRSEDGRTVTQTEETKQVPFFGGR